MGTPGKRFNLILDSGSADLWLADALAKSLYHCALTRLKELQGFFTFGELDEKPGPENKTFYTDKVTSAKANPYGA